MTSILARNAGGGQGKSGFASFGANTCPQLVGSGAALALSLPGARRRSVLSLSCGLAILA
ncbi:hypothetical protein ELQ36_01675 [Methylococcus capsulatus]|nr:hypothetical protein [Methylococcus capsulatus]